MLTQELAYINPVTGLVEERSEYLSGNVRDKLLQAEQANENGLFQLPTSAHCRRSSRWTFRYRR